MPRTPPNLLAETEQTCIFSPPPCLPDSSSVKATPLLRARYQKGITDGWLFYYYYYFIFSILFIMFFLFSCILVCLFPSSPSFPPAFRFVILPQAARFKQTLGFPCANFHIFQVDPMVCSIPRLCIPSVFSRLVYIFWPPWGGLWLIRVYKYNSHGQVRWSHLMVKGRAPTGFSTGNCIARVIAASL